MGANPVRTDEIDFLLKLGVDLVQSFFVAPPKPSDEVLDWVSESAQADRAKARIVAAERPAIACLAADAQGPPAHSPWTGTQPPQGRGSGGEDY